MKIEETFMSVCTVAEFFILEAEIFMCDLAQQLGEKVRMNVLFYFFRTCFFLVSLLKLLCIFEYCYEFILEIIGQNTILTTRIQSNIHLCQCSNGDDHGECSVAGGENRNW